MTTGEQIAKTFSDDKHHLSDTEQRRLAGMIDAELSTTVEALRAALYWRDGLLAAERGQDAKSMAAVFGKWPGDESDEEVLRALIDIS